MSAPRYTDLVKTLPASVPFVGPETQERANNQLFAARLGANESIFGPSPKAIAAMQSAAQDVWKYPDPENHELKQALSAHHNIPTDSILVGEGIDGLLGYTVRLLIEQGDAVVTSDGAYPTFNYHVAGFGGQLHKVPYTQDHEDPQALISKAKDVDAKLIYLSNPDNPMGTLHSAETIKDMIDTVPNNAVLVLDEAYIELAPDGSAPDFDVTIPNVIRMRTFSKAYGMAGLRIGYAIGHPVLIKSFDKIRNHFGMTKLSQIGALAGLADQDYLQTVRRQVAESRDRLAQIAYDNGLVTLSSATNFVTIDCGADGYFARKVLAEMLALGIFVRMPFVAPQDRCIRISCGPQEEMDAVAKALPKALSKARSA